MAMSIRKNDQVVIRAGKDRGKRGRVLSVVPEKNRVVVEGVNLIKRHTRPNPQKNIKGGIVEREAPVNAIWEGSGNVQCLDVLRAMQKTPAVVGAFFDELARARGGALWPRGQRQVASGGGLGAKIGRPDHLCPRSDAGCARWPAGGGPRGPGRSQLPFDAGVM